MPGKVAKIGTFSDWVGLFDDWRKEIGVNTGEIASFKFDTLYGAIDTEEIQFGSFKGRRKWENLRQVATQQMRDALKDQQEILRVRRGLHALQIVYVVPTRWNSVLYSAQRIAQLKDCIVPIIPDVVAFLKKRKKTSLHSFTYTEGTFWQPLLTLTSSAC